MIAIIDYRAGNIESVKNALSYIGKESIITSKIRDIKNANHLILPGVGSFSNAMQNLIDLNLVDTIKKEIKKGKQFLGICLGMQVLAKKGFEIDPTEGLNIFDGDVIKFVSETEKIPHVGWNEIKPTRNSDLFKNIDDLNFYFTHSYYLSVQQNTLSITNYIQDFSSCLEYENIHAVQFHPEKSGKSGLQLLKNFTQLGD